MLHEKLRVYAISSVQKKIGDLVTDIHSSIDRMGCVIAQRGDAAAAIEACEQAMKQIKIEIYEEKSGK